MKVLKYSQFLHLKGQFTVWLWPAIYISYTKGSLSIQFSWLNFTATISFLSNALYYESPLLWSKEEYEEYLEKGEKEYLKDKT